MRFCALATAPRRGSLNDVDDPHHEIAVPAWRMLTSGLIVPSSVADRLESGRPEIAVPPELTLSPAPVAVVEQLPVSADQMGGAINEEELGLPPADLDELIARVRELPFEHAFLLIARIAAAVWHMREDAERQLELVRTFKMPNLVDRLERVLPVRDSRARRVAFAEQYLTVLQRVLTQHARDATLAEGVTEDFRYRRQRSTVDRLLSTGSSRHDRAAGSTGYDPLGPAQRNATGAAARVPVEVDTVAPCWPRSHEDGSDSCTDAGRASDHAGRTVTSGAARSRGTHVLSSCFAGNSAACCDLTFAART
jgi:hypothetical protein